MAPNSPTLGGEGGGVMHDIYKISVDVKFILMAYNKYIKRHGEQAISASI